MSKFTGYESEIKDGKILSIQMNILNRCTSRCKSCRKYTWPDDMLMLVDIKNTLKVLKDDFGLQTVVFSGGDPILYPQFSEVIDYCNELGIAYSLITTLITKDIELLKKIANTAYRIHCSVDSTFRSIYKDIRGVDGLEIVKQNTKVIQSIRITNNLIPIRISSTIGKMNYDEVYNLYKFAKENKCLINFYFLHTWDNLKMEYDEIGYFYKQIEDICYNEKYENEVISNARSILLQKYDYDTENYAKECKTCYIPRVGAVINANGDIYPCCFLLQDNNDYGPQLKYAYGNIRNKGLEEIRKEFEKRNNKQYPVKHTHCDECGQRYSGELKELETIIDGPKVKVFL